MPVLLTNRRKKPRVSTPWARDLSHRLLCALGEPDAELSVCLVGDEDIRPLNAQWRGRDKPTDVLSFSQVEGDVPWPEAEPASADIAAQGGRVLGDIVISLDTAARQAKAYGHTLEIEVGRLLIHGAAHLLGHDHVHGGAEAQKMYRLEERLMRALGIPLKP